MKINRDGFSDNLPRTTFRFTDGTQEVCCFDRSKWQWWWLKADGTRQLLRGVTGTVHVMGGKLEAIVGWAKRVVLEKLRRLMLERHLGPDECLQLFVSELDKIIVEAKRANDEALEEAGNIGHDAHEWIENYIKADLAGDVEKKEELLALLPVDERAANACIAAILWMDRHNVRWVCTERPVFSRRFGYCGTTDGVCVCDSCDDPRCCPKPFVDLPCLCDWKTSGGKVPYLEYIYQTASYVFGLAEMDGTELGGRWINILDKTTAEFNAWFFPADTQADDFKGFLRCMRLCESIDLTSDRLDKMNDERKAAIAVEKAKAKAERLKQKCAGAAKYKGVRPPKCNGGDPCEFCKNLFEEKQRERANQSA